jgi:hypothetical protein
VGAAWGWQADNAIARITRTAARCQSDLILMTDFSPSWKNLVFGDSRLWFLLLWFGF